MFEIGATVFADNTPGTLGRENESYRTNAPAREVYALANGCVHGPSGIVYEPKSRTVVRETLEHWDVAPERHPVFATPGYPAPQRLPGVSLLLAGLGGQTFYHFLIENLPKLALVQPLLDQVDQVLVSRYIESAKARWLERAIGPKRIVWIGELGHYRCDQLIFTNRVVAHFEPNPWAVHTVRSLLRTPAPAPATDVLWLDRTRERNRSVSWEGEFQKQLPGLKSVDFSTLSPEETVATCARARAIIGLHGAAFANMVFCQPGTIIVELATKPFHPWYPRLAQVCGHTHTTVRVNDDLTARGEAVKMAQQILQLA